MALEGKKVVIESGLDNKTLKKDVEEAEKIIKKLDTVTQRQYKNLTSQLNKYAGQIKSLGATGAISPTAVKSLTGRAAQLRSFGIEKIASFQQGVGGLPVYIAQAKKEAALLAKENKKLADSFKGVHKPVKDTYEGFIRMGGATHGLMRDFSRLRNQLLVFAFMTAAIRAGFMKAVDESIKLQNALIGLTTVAKAFGAGAVEAKQAALSLAEDGLMTISEASTALKNLLATGFSLPEAVNLMNAFKDAAAFGRQGSLDFGQAIIGASEGLKNQNSLLVDNVGITKNLSVILKEAGYSMSDLAKVTTDANVRQALYVGILKEASAFSGDAARAANTLGGSYSKMQVSSKLLFATVGEALTPAIMEFNKWIKESNDRVREFTIKIKDAISLEVVQVFTLLKTILAPIGLLLENLLRIAVKFPPEITTFVASLVILKVSFNLLMGPIATLKKALQSLIGLFTVMDAATNKLKFSLAGLKSAMGVWGWIAAGVSVLITVFVSLISRQKEAMRQQEELNDKLKEEKEIRKAGIDAQIARITKLEEENEATQEQIDLLIKLKGLKAKIDEEDLFGKIQAAYKAAYGRSLLERTFVRPGFASGLETMVSLNLDAKLKEISEYEDLIAELIAAGKTMAPEVNKMMSNLRNEANALAELTALIDEYLGKKKKLPDIKQSSKEYIDLLDDINDRIDQSTIKTKSYGSVAAEMAAKRTKTIEDLRDEIKKLSEAEQESIKPKLEALKAQLEAEDAMELTERYSEVLDDINERIEQSKIKTIGYGLGLTVVAEMAAKRIKTIEDLRDKIKEFLPVEQKSIELKLETLGLQLEAEDAMELTKRQTDYQRELNKEYENTLGQYCEMISKIADVDAMEKVHTANIEEMKAKLRELGVTQEKITETTGKWIELYKKIEDETRRRQDPFEKELEAYYSLTVAQRKYTDIMVDSWTSAFAKMGEVFQKHNIKQIKGWVLLGNTMKNVAASAVSSTLDMYGDLWTKKGMAMLIEASGLQAMLQLDFTKGVTAGLALIAVGGLAKSFAASMANPYNANPPCGGGGEGAVGVAGGEGGTAKGATITGTVQARELTIYIAPVVNFEAGNDIWIGSGTVAEVGPLLGATIVEYTQQAIETGELNVSKFGG
jgi:hypothetical protein